MRGGAKPALSGEGRGWGRERERWEEVLVLLEEGVLWETEGKTRTGVWKGQGQEGMGVEWGRKHSPWVTSEGGREGCQ